MATESVAVEQPRPSRAWLAHFVMSVLLVLNMLFLLFVGGGPSTFESDTGVPYAEVQADYPTVAKHVVDQERILSIGYAGFALFAAAIAYGPYRAGDRWAWNAMWILPGTLTVVAVAMFLFGAGYIGAFYAVLAAITAGIQIYGRRGFA